MARSRTAAATDPPAPKLSGVVLVVEDEPTVRKLLQRMLEMNGLVVLTTDDPAEAIAISSDTLLDAMVTDLQLPGMGGLELTARVRSIRPGLPVVLVSGHPREEAFAGCSRVPAGTEFLQKPFTPTQLANVLRRMLPPPTASDPKPPLDDTKEMPALPPPPT